MINRKWLVISSIVLYALSLVYGICKLEEVAYSAFTSATTLFYLALAVENKDGK